MYTKHYPVLLDEVIECFGYLEDIENPRVVDLTFGGGGHSLALLTKYKNLKITAFDQDEEAIQNAQSLKDTYGDKIMGRLKLIHSNFMCFKKFLDEEALERVDGVLVDLGVSTHQLKSSQRGFSFQAEGPLDMRMSKSNLLTAKQVLNEYDEESLIKILELYGEEKFAKSIVSNIIEARGKKPLETTKDLENVVFHSYPKRFRFGRTHPATKTFQALRIHINDELNIIEDVLKQSVERLNINGRVAAISFHSLEDRIVKHTFKEMGRQKIVELLTKKPIIPSQDEITENKASRSSKLRIVKKLEGVNSL